MSSSKSRKKKLKESLPTNPSGPGVMTKFWVWASAVPTNGVPRKKSSTADSQGEKAPAVSPASGNLAGGLDAYINDLLTQNANISAATFLNLLRSSGVTFSKEGFNGQGNEKAGPASGASRQADTSGANQQALRARESWVFRSTFTESAASDNGIGPTKFRVVLLAEGLGNLRDGYYYSKEALKSAVAVFEGKKIYADHPSATEEQTRPERSVRDVLGHFENLAYEETKDGQGLLVGDVVVLPDKPYEWARSLLRHAVEFGKKHPDKEFVGLSINANGDAEQKNIDDFMKSGEVPEAAISKLQKAKENGMSDVRVVRSITEAVSCDLVTEAGAGGKVTEILESKSGKGESSKQNPGTKEEQMAMDDKKKPEGEEAPEAAPADKKEGDAPEGAEHKDEQQDAILIKQMLDKYLGDEEHPEELAKQAKEAYEAAMGEGGMKSEEAMEMVGQAMKCARMMKKKEAAAKEAAEKKEGEEKSVEASSEEAAKEGKAMESDVLKLKAENATLKESLAAIALEKYMDEKLAATKLDRKVTKAFREAAGKIKNKEDFEQKLAIFVKAREAVSGEVDGASWFTTEKAIPSEGGSAFSLEDCVK